MEGNHLSNPLSHFSSFLPSFFLPVPLTFTLSAFLHIFRSEGSELHDDFPSVAERTVGQGTAGAFMQQSDVTRLVVNILE